MPLAPPHKGGTRLPRDKTHNDRTQDLIKKSRFLHCMDCALGNLDDEVMGLAFYRKYRPKKFAELLGQETNVEILKNAAKSDRLGHAYLFYGPRGSGKTTTARLLAKLMNCERRLADPRVRETGEPCNECQSCKEIDAGASFDLIEIDAASNRGIDEIRNLKESIAVSPAKSPLKVYIIDEAHMLTREATNALLKTLEEPPRHAVLILATTEYEKLPPTVTSRVQRFLFRKLPKMKIAQKLHTIARAERMDIEPAALELIAAAAEGSLRDAESLLDQIASLETRIDLDAVERITGRVGLKTVRIMAELLLKNETGEALHALAELNAEGHNLTQFTKDLIHYVRKAIALKLNPSLQEFFQTDLTAEEIGDLKKLGEHIVVEKHLALLQHLIRAYSEMRYSPLTMIPLEIALIEEKNRGSVI